jgi:Zn-dependent membrane protease YugP
MTSVPVKHVSGTLTDHYDPRDKSLSLSDSVYGNSSIAAIGVAAHEVGHAIQHNVGYAPLGIRNSFVPVANLGSAAAIPIFFIGFLFRGPVFMEIGILLFLAVVVFHLITLPVEFNASSRALAILRQTAVLDGPELEGAGRVLNAAAWTYIAATIVALAHLLRLVLMMNSRSRD